MTSYKYNLVHMFCSIISIYGDSQLFSLGTLVSFTNKTDCHDITEILLKVALSTTNQTCDSEKLISR
jgi:hypothetical protein